MYSMPTGHGPLAVDTETCAFGPGNMAPDLVVLSWAEETAIGPPAKGLVPGTDAVKFLEGQLSSGRIIVLHNGAYDLVVLARAAGVKVRRTDPDSTAAGQTFLTAVWAHIQAGKVKDTQLRNMLATIAEGTFKAERAHNSLARLAQKHRTGLILNKSDDSWRTRYGELLGVPLEDWPEEARTYALEDAEATLEVYLAQERCFGFPDHYVAEEARQVAAALALQLACAWGIRADAQAAKALRAHLTESMQRWEAELLGAGLLKRKRTWARQGGYRAATARARDLADMAGVPWDKAARARFLVPDYDLAKDLSMIRGRVEKALGRYAPLTDKGQISTAKETLLDTGDDLLIKLADRGTYEKTLGFVDILDKATGDLPFCPRWNPLMETGRTSCGSPDDPGNLQNQPRAPGVRECYLAAPGNVYVACDYDTAELRALAQVLYSWFGWSKMRDAIIDGQDIHQSLADNLDWLDRQGAKPINFGLPGGLGDATLIKYVKSYTGGTTILTRREAREVREAYFRTWPEMKLYFDRIATYTEGGKARMRAYWSGRFRGGMSFSQAANGQFQQLVADGAKKALVRVTMLCYGSEGPLAGFRVVAFVHDEIILEGPEDRAHDAALELERVMCEEMQEVMPDVPVTASAHLMFRWYKKAKACKDANGRLVPWEPESEN